MQKETQVEFDSKCKILLKPLESVDDLQNWLYVFLDLYFPKGTVYPSSTHGPADAMWRIYELMRTGDNIDIPQVCMLASRDSFKTLGAAALEVLCLLHFRISLAHMAAISSQSDKAIQYVNAFFRKLKPYMEANGWKQSSDNKKMIAWLTDEGQEVYIRIVIATIAGANSEHVPMLFIDEVDVVQDPRALKEAQMIPSTFGDYYPLTVYLSTRKFAGGLMEKTLKQTINAGGEILRWNILDVTERIPHDVAKVDEPRKIRYISRDLPMETLLEEDWKRLPDETKHKYERLEAYAGIADHAMLPIMRNYLVDRPQDDHGGLYKKLAATHNNFKTLDADMADAQLLCNKPSSSGLVYPRFDERQNVLSVQEAWEKISGNDTPCNFIMLKQYLMDLGIVKIGGGDWGFTDWTVLPVLALLPGGEIWHLHTFMAPGLEIDDIVKYGTELQDDYSVDKWYVDQNYPSYLKTLRRKAGWTCPKFTKDVAAGISALQGKIVDSTNVRKYYIIDTPENRPVIDAFGEYRWATDGKGEIIEGKPYHDKEGVSDIMDSIRYPFQNLFSKGAKPSFSVAGQESKDKQKQLVTSASDLKEMARNVNNDLMKQKIASLATNTPTSAKKPKSKKKILW